MTTDKFSLTALTTYAVTLNPCDETQFFTCTTPSQRWQKVTERFALFLKNQLSFTYELYYECSSPDHYNKFARSRIHCHGFIKITDLPQFLLIDINRLAEWCDIKIKQVTDREGYLQYCTKQHTDLEGMFPLIHSSEIEFKRKQKEKEAEDKLIQRRFGVKGINGPI